MAHLATQAIPDFSGEATLPDGTPSMGIREFVQRVDDIKASTNSTNQVIAGAVKQHLVGAAYTWYQVQVQRGSRDLTEWDPVPAVDNVARIAGLKEKLEEEYIRARTPAQVQTLLHMLKQKQGEDANSFYRRVEHVSLILINDAPATARNEGPLLFNWILERDIQSRFITGLHMETRQFLLNEDLDNADDLRKAAIRFETARQSRSQGQIHAVQPQDGADNLRGKIEALEQKLGKLLSNASPSYSGPAAQAGPARRGGPPDVSTLPAGYCHYCSIEGHKKDECRKLAKDRSEGRVQQHHDNFVNGGKKRQKRQFRQGGQSQSQVAELATPLAQNQSAQASQQAASANGLTLGAAATQWYHEGQMAAMQPGQFYLPPLN